MSAVNVRFRTAWGAMGSKVRQEVYLAKAKEAEEQAEKTKDEANKSSWLRIAAGYHDLAAREAGTEQK